MAFREYKIGVRMFGLALGLSMMITLYFPSLDINAVASTRVALDKQLAQGRVLGFSMEDPMVLGKNKPIKVKLDKDPSTGRPIESTDAYVFPAGAPFPSGILHTRTLGKGVEELSVSNGRIGEADSVRGAVFVVSEGVFEGGRYPYIENATATRGWGTDQVMQTAGDANAMYVGKGKSMFVREGCWWCHTLLPEQTQDWQYFGAPPMLGDFNGESPTAFGSDRKAPDLLHVGSRNSSREWMMMHFFNPRLVQPHSIMPRYDYLWGDKDVNGKTIDFAAWRTAYNEYASGTRVSPPEVPEYARDSNVRALIDFVLNLK